MATRVRADQIQGTSSTSTLLDRLNEIAHVKPPVAATTDLPTTASDGEVRLVKGESIEYRYDGVAASWKPVQKSTWDDKYTKSETDTKLSNKVDGTTAMTVSATAPASPAGGDLWVSIL